MRSAQPRNECTPVRALVVVVVRLFPKWCCRIAHTKRTNISCPQQNGARCRRCASHTRLALCALGVRRRNRGRDAFEARTTDMPAVWSDLLNVIVGISIGVTAKGWVQALAACIHRGSSAFICSATLRAEPSTSPILLRLSSAPRLWHEPMAQIRPLGIYVVFNARRWPW